MSDLAFRARALLGKKTGGPESAVESTHARTGPPDQRDVDVIARQLRHASTPDPESGTDPGQRAARLAASLVEQAQGVVDALEAGASVESFSDAQIAAIESVIRTRGRPALAIDDDGLEDLNEARHPGSGFWRIPVEDHEVQLMRVIRATGAVIARVAGQSIVCGTAWLIAPGVVVTNRHVVLPPRGRSLVTRAAARPTEASLDATVELLVDFAYQKGPVRDRQTRVSAVAFVSEDADPVDVAVLRIATTPAGASPLPLSTAADASRQLFLCGHPGLMAQVPTDVRLVFGNPDGRKRVCFGERLAAGAAGPGELAHDASTIGGFSGACVQAFGGAGVSALHYYGDPIRGNRAITSQRLRSHAVAAFL